MDFRRPVQAVIPGAHGRILAVLAETSAELNLRTIARLSGVSVAQTSRSLPTLVQLGIVERREVPPSALFRLVEEHVAAPAILALARARETVLEELSRAALELPTPPASLVVFGSLARGEAGPDSDIDVVVIRPESVGEDDDEWTTGIEGWRQRARRLTGNPVEVVDVSERDVARLLRSRRPLWVDVARDGIVIAGRSLDDLGRRRIA